MTIAPWILAGSIFAAALLASGAGTGGGALYVSAYVLAYHGDTLAAVPLSKASILGLALATLSASLTNRSDRVKLHVNYPTSALLEPPTLLGTIVGIWLNRILPSTVCVILLAICLILAAHTTLKKANQLLEKERRLTHDCLEAENETALRQAMLRSPHPLKTCENKPLATPATASSTCSGENLAEPAILVVVPPDSEQSSSWPSDRTQIKTSETLTAIALTYLIADWTIQWGVLFIVGGPIALVRGSFRAKSLLIGLILIKLIGIHIYCWSIKDVYADHLRSSSQTHHQDETINKLTPKRIVVYTYCGIFAGILAGALGIGGGLVKGPLMIHMGLEPLSAVSTASFMLLFTSTSTTLSFALAGQLNLKDGLFYGLASFLGAFLGIHIIKAYVTKHNRQSFISYMLAGVLILSMLSLLALPFIRNDATSRP